MKGNSFASIRRIFWLGIGVVVALVGCEPSSITTTPPATLPPATLTAYIAGVESLHSSRPLPISIAAVIRRDDDAGWHHYWGTSSQREPVNDLAFDGQWVWIVTAEGLIRLDPNSLNTSYFPVPVPRPT